MTCNQVLNSIGLTLGIAGAAVIFKYGPPQPNLEEATLRSITGPIADANAAVARKLKRKHKIWSSIGLGLIMLGFAVQLIAVWIN